MEDFNLKTARENLRKTLVRLRESPEYVTDEAILADIEHLIESKVNAALLRWSRQTQ